MEGMHPHPSRENWIKELLKKKKRITEFGLAHQNKT